MANEEQLIILADGGVAVWNDYREKHLLIDIDLSGVDLSGKNLAGVNLSEANLSYSILNDVNLVKADFSNANLQGAVISNSDLRLANLFATNLNRANFAETNLAGASFDQALFSQANFASVDLSGAKLVGYVLGENQSNQPEGLTQEQINGTYHERGKPPELPDGLNPGKEVAFQVNVGISDQPKMMKAAATEKLKMEEEMLSELDRPIGKPLHPDKLYDLLTSSVTDWNEFRNDNPNTPIEFYPTDLSGQNLQGADLSLAFMEGADLSRTNISGGSLVGADLSRGKLIDATLNITDMTNADLDNTDISGADMRDAQGLTQDQLSTTIADLGNPPRLPNGLFPGSPYRRVVTSEKVMINRHDPAGERSNSQDVKLTADPTDRVYVSTKQEKSKAQSASLEKLLALREEMQGFRSKDDVSLGSQNRAELPLNNASYQLIMGSLEVAIAAHQPHPFRVQVEKILADLKELLEDFRTWISENANNITVASLMLVVSAAITSLGQFLAVAF